MPGADAASPGAAAPAPARVTYFSGAAENLDWHLALQKQYRRPPLIEVVRGLRRPDHPADGILQGLIDRGRRVAMVMPVVHQKPCMPPM